MACNLNSHIKTEGLLNVTDSHANRKRGSVIETVLDSLLLLQTTNSK